MLGVIRKPCQWPADTTLKEIADEMGKVYTFQPTDVGVFFGDSNKESQLVPDPYFKGQGLPAKDASMGGLHGWLPAPSCRQTQALILV